MTTPTTQGLKLETVEISGDFSSMGEQLGEAKKDAINAFIAQRMRAVSGYVDDRGHAFDVDRFLDIGRQSMSMHADWHSDGAIEMAGIARGADVDPLSLFVAANMTDMRDAYLLFAESGPTLDLRADAEGCTSVLLAPNKTASGNALAGQTWDLNPPDVEFVIAVNRKPTSGPSTWSVTCVGCLSLMGINEFGVSVGTTNIKTYGSKPGVGYMSILHRMLAEENVAGVRKVVKEAPHAGAHTYWTADSSEQVEWEASPNGVFERSASESPIFRTNHCLFDDHTKIQGETPGESSKSRFARAEGLLGSTKYSAESMRTFFANRDDGVLSINRYADDDLATATNAVFIAEPSAKKAWACRGPADRGEWLELSF